MKHFFLVLFTASCLIVFSCSPKDDKTTKDNTEKKHPKSDDATDDETTKDDTSNDMTKAAGGVCNCMSDAMDGLSSKSKAIIIKAGASSDPTQTMKAELEKIDDADEKQKIGMEFQKFGKLAQDPDMMDCVRKVEKKYNVDDKDIKAQKQIIRVLQDKENCDVVAALMNIGVKQDAKNRGTE